jgi:hypothetical protein
MRKKQKTRRIWRLETKDGRGVYESGHYWKVADHEPDRHPTPFLDLGLDFNSWEEIGKFHFGFASIEQYTQWMYRRKWRMGFEEKDLVLSRYEVPVRHSRVGDKQAVFKKKYAKLIEQRSPAYMD